MQVQVNTGNGIENKETLERWADGFLNESLARFKQEITRVEVQLTDENSGRKGAADKRCMLEARLNGHEPLAVNHHGETQDEAFRGATQRLIRLDHTWANSTARAPRARHHPQGSDVVTSDGIIPPPFSADQCIRQCDAPAVVADGRRLGGARNGACSAHPPMRRRQ